MLSIALVYIFHKQCVVGPRLLFIIGIKRKLGLVYIQENNTDRMDCIPGIDDIAQTIIRSTTLTLVLSNVKSAPLV